MTRERFAALATDYARVTAALAPRWTARLRLPALTPTPTIEHAQGNWTAIIPHTEGVPITARMDLARALGVLLVPGARSDLLYTPDTT